MAIEMHDGRITGSSGVAKAGLTLGIIGTGLAALNGGGNGNGILGNLFGGNNCAKNAVAELEAEVAELKSMRYTDYVGIDLYKSIIATQKEESHTNYEYPYMIGTEFNNDDVNYFSKEIKLPFSA